MSLSVARALPRVARISRSQLRRYASAAPEHPPGYVPTGEEFLAQRAAIKEHAKETTDLWRKISLYICIPGATVMGLYVKKVEDEHHAHVEHEKHAHPEHEVGTPNYSWLNKRTKPFPWGSNSLFFNPETNRDHGHPAEEE